MSLNRALSHSLKCNSCHYTCINTLISLAGFTIRPATRLQSRTVFKPAISSTFTTSGPRGSELAQFNDAGEVEDSPQRVADQKEPDTELPPSSGTDEAIPWYLRLPSLAPTPSSLAERQKLPELPPDPPPLLQPLIEHVSIDIGLDDLTLLDLRHLDPPPALGANLLMIIGTARSEKHLHVSADRFCRWLRTNYKLRPYADGLLGRNELKLKLRRKARRAKLLGSTGSTEAANSDDGIRTGWVCVNIGVIGEAKSVSEEELTAAGFVGFGGQSEGVKLVVQMLTEEKREELDLESIWGGFLRRHQRKQEREAEKSRLEAEEQVSAPIQALGAPATNIEKSKLSETSTTKLAAPHTGFPLHQEEDRGAREPSAGE